ncbi:jg11287, partial [Pararge aegeria aegeria]
DCAITAAEASVACIESIHRDQGIQMI